MDAQDGHPCLIQSALVSFVSVPRAVEIQPCIPENDDAVLWRQPLFPDKINDPADPAVDIPGAVDHGTPSLLQ